MKFQIVSHPHAQPIKAVVAFPYKNCEISISTAAVPNELVIFDRNGRFEKDFGTQVPSAENIKAAMAYIDENS